MHFWLWMDVRSHMSVMGFANFLSPSSLHCYSYKLCLNRISKDKRIGLHINIYTYAKSYSFNILWFSSSGILYFLIEYVYFRYFQHLTSGNVRLLIYAKIKKGKYSFMANLQVFAYYKISSKYILEILNQYLKSGLVSSNNIVIYIYIYISDFCSHG